MQYRETIGSRIDNALFLMNELFISLAPLYQENCGQEQSVTVPLFTMLHSTSSTILSLLSEEMALPDADVLLRTVMEGTVKYCYMLNGTPEERRIKFEEYRYALYGMEMVSDHKKAVETLGIFEEFSIDNSTIPFEVSILPDDLLKNLQSQYTNKQKDEIKRKWTYQAMLRSLAKDRPEYKAQLGSLSTYASTSHYAHFDYTGLSSRQAQLKAIAKNTDGHYDVVHGFRIISNILSFAMFRACEYINVYGCKSRETIGILDAMAKGVGELDSFSNKLLSAMEIHKN